MPDLTGNNGEKYMVQILLALACTILCLQVLGLNKRIEELEDQVDNLPDSADYGRLRNELVKELTEISHNVRATREKTEGIYNKMFKSKEKKQPGLIAQQPKKEDYYMGFPLMKVPPVVMKDFYKFGNSVTKAVDMAKDKFSPFSLKFSMLPFPLPAGSTMTVEASNIPPHDQEYERIVGLNLLTTAKDMGQAKEWLDEAIKLGDIHIHSDKTIYRKKLPSNFFREHFKMDTGITEKTKKKNEGYKKRTRDANGRFI